MATRKVVTALYKNGTLAIKGLIKKTGASSRYVSTKFTGTQHLPRVGERLSQSCYTSPAGWLQRLSGIVKQGLASELRRKAAWNFKGFGGSGSANVVGRGFAGFARPGNVPLVALVGFVFAPGITKVDGKAEVSFDTPRIKDDVRRAGKQEQQLTGAPDECEVDVSRDSAATADSDDIIAAAPAVNEVKVTKTEITGNHGNLKLHVRLVLDLEVPDDCEKVKLMLASSVVSSVASERAAFTTHDVILNRGKADTEVIISLDDIIFSACMEETNQKIATESSEVKHGSIPLYGKDKSYVQEDMSNWMSVRQNEIELWTIPGSVNANEENVISDKDKRTISKLCHHSENMTKKLTMDKIGKEETQPEDASSFKKEDDFWVVRETGKDLDAADQWQEDMLRKIQEGILEEAGILVPATEDGATDDCKDRLFTDEHQFEDASLNLCRSVKSPEGLQSFEVIEEVDVKNTVLDSFLVRDLQYLYGFTPLQREAQKEETENEEKGRNNNVSNDRSLETSENIMSPSDAQDKQPDRPQISFSDLQIQCNQTKQNQPGCLSDLEIHTQAKLPNRQETMNDSEIHYRNNSVSEKTQQSESLSTSEAGFSMLEDTSLQISPNDTDTEAVKEHIRCNDAGYFVPFEEQEKDEDSEDNRNTQGETGSVGHQRFMAFWGNLQDVPSVPFSQPDSIGNLWEELENIFFQKKETQ